MASKVLLFAVLLLGLALLVSTQGTRSALFNSTSLSGVMPEYIAAITNTSASFVRQALRESPILQAATSAYQEAYEYAKVSCVTLEALPSAHFLKALTSMLRSARNEITNTVTITKLIAELSLLKSLPYDNYAEVLASVLRVALHTISNGIEHTIMGLSSLEEVINTSMNPYTAKFAVLAIYIAAFSIGYLILDVVIRLLDRFWAWVFSAACFVE